MKIKVVSGGTSVAVPVLSQTFAKLLDSMPNVEAEFILPQQYRETNWNDVNVIWNIGFFFHVDCFLDSVKALYPHVKVVNTWVGSDIGNSVQWFKERVKCTRCALRSIDIHVSDGANLQQELKALLGLDSFYVASVPDPVPLTPLVSTDRVAVYSPAHRKDFYRHDIILEVASQRPLFNFDFYSMTPDNEDYHGMPNCHFRGFFQGEAKIRAFSEASILFVFPKHGSVSMMLIEFMQMGRRVVSNIPAPYVYQVQEPVTAEMILEQLDLAEKNSHHGPNKEASEYYHKEYGWEKVKEQIQPVMDKLNEIGEYVY